MARAVLVDSLARRMIPGHGRAVAVGRCLARRCSSGVRCAPARGRVVVASRCLALLVFFSGAAWAGDVTTRPAQPPTQPLGVDVPGGGGMPQGGPGDATVGNPVTETSIPYKVKGFRSARFGTDEAAVRKAMTLDFQLSGDSIERFSHPLQRTTVLRADLDRLEPGRGPASLRYILGYRSRTLVQVDVLWQVRSAERPPIEDIISTGSVLGSYFDGFSWRKDSVRRLSLLSDDTVLVWQGEELEGTGAVRVLLSGVEISSSDQSQKELADKVRVLQLVSREGEAGPRTFYAVDARLNDANPLSLLVSYIADRDQPDIYVIPEGDF